MGRKLEQKMRENAKSFLLCSKEFSSKLSHKMPKQITNLIIKNYVNSCIFEKIELSHLSFNSINTFLAENSRLAPVTSSKNS